MQDRRIRKSKQALKDSLIQLLKEKAMMKISVKDLVQVADLNRSTFYSYYTDIQNMVCTLENEIYEEISQTIATYIALRERTPPKELEHFTYQFIEDLCLVIESHRHFCGAIASPNGDIGFIIKIGHLLEDNIRLLFSELFTPDFGHYPYMYAFIKGGIVGILEQWISQDFEDQPEHIAQSVYNYTVACITSTQKGAVAK